MGLFEKKVDVVIAFVGKYTQRVNSIQERAVAVNYRQRLQAMIQQNYPGVSRFRVWFFDNWSKELFSTSTLNSVKNSGFSAFDTGEKKDLYDAIERVLVLKYSSSMKDYHPAVIVETMPPFAGVFTILCKVPVKESKLA